MTHLPTGERVIVRFYGSSLTGKGNKYKPVTQEEEVKIIDELSQWQLAPKILFAFDEGRIESFVEGRLIATEEIVDKEINEKIAKLIAQIHSMKIVLDRKEALFNLDILYNFLGEFEKKKNAASDELSDSDRVIRDDIYSHDLRKEAEWVAFLFKKFPARIVFSHNDVHRKNVFVQGEEGQSDLTLKLMDYEYSCYNYRWADLANHLCEISLHSFDLESGECKIGPLSRDERMAFIRVYLNEWTKLSKEADDEVDSLENVMMQVDFGLLVVHLMRVLFFAAYIGTNYGPLQSWPYTKVRFQRYLQSKEEFITHYSRLLK